MSWWLNWHWAVASYTRGSSWLAGCSSSFWAAFFFFASLTFLPWYSDHIQIPIIKTTMIVNTIASVSIPILNLRPLTEKKKKLIKKITKKMKESSGESLHDLRRSIRMLYLSLVGVAKDRGDTHKFIVCRNLLRKIKREKPRLMEACMRHWITWMKRICWFFVSTISYSVVIASYQ